MNPNQMKQMMAQAQKMQADLEKNMKKIDDKEFTITVGGGMVELTMFGNKVVKSLNIKEDVIDPEDKDMLQDMIVSAFNQANEQIDAEKTAAMGPLSQMGGLPF